MKININFEVKEETEDDNINEVVQMLLHIADSIDAGFLSGTIPPCGSTDTISGAWGVVK